MASRFVNIPLLDRSLEFCIRHGQLMRDGNVKLSNVKHGDIDNVENYTDGKVGEVAFYQWLLAQKIKVIHKPFRADYSSLNPDDDFIIEIDGDQFQVEVRHKTRNVLPRSNFEHCSDTIKDDRIYVFTDRCRVTRRRQGETIDIDHLRGDVNIVGWVDPFTFREKATFIKKGTEMSGDHGRLNFTTHRDEYNIQIADLFDMDTLVTSLTK